MKKYALALDLKDDPALIAGYVNHHRQVWPDIEQSLRASGILTLEIYLVLNRLCMVMETTDDFSFEKKKLADAANPSVQAWETLMWQYQQALPLAKPDEKWRLMEKIYELR